MKVLLASLAFAAPLHAQDLLLDIYQGAPFPESSVPSDVIAFGDGLLMQARLGGLGDEVVRWDGNQATLVADILAGPDGSDPREFTPAGEQVFFIARAAGKGRELWVTDGVSGAQLVVDLAPGPSSANYESLAALGDELAFLAKVSNPFGASDLFVSDGSPSGTFAFDLAGSGITQPADLIEFDGRLFFRASSAATGSELWSTDGAGVQLEADLVPGEVSSVPGEFTPFDGSLYFRAGDGGGGAIWRTDGTTFEVALSSAEVGTPDFFVAGGGLLYFTAESALAERELWRTDGTLAGTVQLTELGPDTIIANQYATDIGVFFTADLEGHGRELFFSDGSAEGLVSLEIVHGPSAPSFLEFAVLPDGLAFLARVGPGDVDVWFSDGTFEGTQIVANFDHPQDADPTGLTAVGDRAFFSGDDDSAGVELFVTDGTLAGTGLFADLDPALENGSSSPSDLVDLGGNLFFVAEDATHGREPWVSDGTPAGTHLLRDLAPGVADSDPDLLTPFQDRLVFTTAEQTTARGLWITDGTAMGTQPLADGNVSSATQLIGGSERIYFSGSTADEGLEPWTSDGTAAGTQLLADLIPGADSSIPHDFLELQGGIVIFSALSGEAGHGLFATDGHSTLLLMDDSPNHLTRFGTGAIFSKFDEQFGTELWLTDGTVAGTELLVDLEPGPSGSSPTSLTIVGERLFFQAEVGALGKELWVSDGTAAGTELVADLAPGSGNSEFSFFTPLGDRLLFARRLGESNSLYITDGTEAGTELLLDLSETATNGQPGVQDGIEVAGDVAWFEVNVDIGTATLWQTDGTVAGTQQILDPDPMVGTNSDKLTSKAPIGSDGTLLFRALSPLAGGEPWVSDGTIAGTGMLADIQPGPGASNPSSFTRAGSTVFFAATREGTGRELYALPFATTESWVIAPYGAGCAGAGDVAPQIDGVGPAVLGGTLGLALNDAAPGAPAALFLSAERFALPIGGGCSLYIGLPLQTIAVLTTDPLGSAALSAPIPAMPALAGVPLHLQFAVVDAQALLGGTLTGGLEVLLGS